MRDQKKKRLQKLYELERAVMSGNEEEAERLRYQFEFGEEEQLLARKRGKPVGAINFKVEEYLQAKEKWPDKTDAEIASELGVNVQTITKCKRKHGLSNMQAKMDNRVKRMKQIVEILKERPEMTKNEIAKMLGVSRSCITKDITKYKEMFGEFND